MADAQLVAAIGPDSAWLPLAIAQLFKTDRLDAARTVAIGLAEARRRGVGARVRRGVDLARMDRAARRRGRRRRGRRSRGLRGPSGASWHHLFPPCCLIDVLVERGELDEAQAILAAAGGEDANASEHGGELLLSTHGFAQSLGGAIRR